MLSGSDHNAARKALAKALAERSKLKKSEQGSAHPVAATHTAPSLTPRTAHSAGQLRHDITPASVKNEPEQIPGKKPRSPLTEANSPTRQLPDATCSFPATTHLPPAAVDRRTGKENVPAVCQNPALKSSTLMPETQCFKLTAPGAKRVRRFGPVNAAAKPGSNLPQHHAQATKPVFSEISVARQRATHAKASPQKSASEKCSNLQKHASQHRSALPGTRPRGNADQPFTVQSASVGTHAFRGLHTQVAKELVDKQGEPSKSRFPWEHERTDAAEQRDTPASLEAPAAPEFRHCHDDEQGFGADADYLPRPLQPGGAVAMQEVMPVKTGLDAVVVTQNDVNGPPGMKVSLAKIEEEFAMSPYHALSWNAYASQQQVADFSWPEEQQHNDQNYEAEDVQMDTDMQDQMAAHHTAESVQCSSSEASSDVDCHECPATQGLGASDGEDVVDVSNSPTDDAACVELQDESSSSSSSLLHWLHALGCSEYHEAFLKAGLTMEDLGWLTEPDLEQLGVTTLGHRKRIFAAAQQLSDTPYMDATAGTALHKTTYRPSSSSAGADDCSKQGKVEVEDRLGKLDSAQEADQKQEQRLPFLSELLMARRRGSAQETVQIPDSNGVQSHFAVNTGVKKGCITNFFAASHKESSGGQPAKPPPAPGQGCPRVKEKPKSNAWQPKAWVPAWQKVPGTSFIVDKFGRRIEEATPCKSWFLTHFHADHYGGLNGRFKSGLIYCTQITATLANQRLNVSLNRIRVVELNQPVIVEGVKVTFLDANHCPGSAMILFEVPGKRPVLHCGDCRCSLGMQLEPALQALRPRKLDLYLDTTYCSPEYDFPSQQEVLRFVIDAFKAEKYNQNKTLFLFGSYTIGKERLFLEAANILQQKIYVSKAKRKVLDALNLPKDYRKLMTENDREATIQAVPMNMVNLKRMASIAKHYRSRFTTIVGIQPTGWTHTAARGTASRGKRLQKGSLILYSVPYSEHSSFKELKGFVNWLQPVNIIPTVGNDRGPKTSRMISLLRE